MEAGIFRSGKRMVIPAPANACAAIKSRPAPTNSGPGQEMCGPQTTTAYSVQGIVTARLRWN